MSEKLYIYEGTVRDFEIDCQGIVNNATYVNYLEQCRNDFLRCLGIDFYEYHKKGYNLVVAGLNIKYRYPLKACDKFYVTAKISSVEHKRIFFEQSIYLKDSNKLIASATVTGACVDLDTDKACMPDFLIELLIPGK